MLSYFFPSKNYLPHLISLCIVINRLKNMNTTHITSQCTAYDVEQVISHKVDGSSLTKMSDKQSKPFTKPQKVSNAGIFRSAND